MDLPPLSHKDTMEANYQHSSSQILQSIFPHRQLSATTKKGMESFFKIFNFKNSKINNGEKHGVFTVGKCYDVQAKTEAATGRKEPVVKKDMEEAINVIEAELRKTMRMRKFMFDYMRISFIRGAQTLPHVDDLRGITETHVVITKQSVEDPLYLCVHLYPSFKCSIVTYKGKEYLLMDYIEGYGLSMVE